MSHGDMLPPAVVMSYVSCLRGECHLCVLHAEHDIDRKLQLDVVGRQCARQMT